MLVLSRRLHEKIIFPSIAASVQVVAVKPGVVRLGIEAPAAVTVLREEVYDRATEWGQPLPALEAPVTAIPTRQLRELVGKRLTIASSGLNLLRQQMDAGFMAEAQDTLDEIVEDVQLLLQRLADMEQPSPLRRPPSRRKALVVEDNANERELLATFLRLGGLDVDTAGDGKDALDYLQARGRPDVMLLDMGLPRCDGPTAVRAIRQNPAYSGLKIFAVTGHLPREYDLEIGPGGIDRWFRKPLDPAVLLQDLQCDLGAARHHA
jgi:carbon storage regulator CsrA